MNQLIVQLKTPNEAGGCNSNPGRQSVGFSQGVQSSGCPVIMYSLTTCCDARNLTPGDPAGNLQLHEQKERKRRLRGIIGSHGIALVPLLRWVIPQ